MEVLSCDDADEHPAGQDFVSVGETVSVAENSKPAESGGFLSQLRFWR